MDKRPFANIISHPDRNSNDPYFLYFLTDNKIPLDFLYMPLAKAVNRGLVARQMELAYGMHYEIL